MKLINAQTGSRSVRSLSFVAVHWARSRAGACEAGLLGGGGGEFEERLALAFSLARPTNQPAR